MLHRFALRSHSNLRYTAYMNRFIITSLLSAGLLFSSAVPMVVQAADTGTVGEAVGLPNPIKCPDATCLVSQVIRYILGIIAVIATIMFIWGGVMMLTSGGNAEQVKRAKETLVWATIGILVIMISWAVIRFVLTGLAGTTG